MKKNTIWMIAGFVVAAVAVAGGIFALVKFWKKKKEEEDSYLPELYTEDFDDQFEEDYFDDCECGCGCEEAPAQTDDLGLNITLDEDRPNEQ